MEVAQTKERLAGQQHWRDRFLASFRSGEFPGDPRGCLSCWSHYGKEGGAAVNVQAYDTGPTITIFELAVYPGLDAKRG
jgi:hypothetical protein